MLRAPTRIGVAGFLDTLVLYGLVEKHFFVIFYSVSILLVVLWLLKSKKLFTDDPLVLTANVTISILLLYITFIQLQFRYLLWSFPLLIFLSYGTGRIPKFLANSLWIMWFVIDFIYTNPFNFVIYPDFRFIFPIFNRYFGFIFGMWFVALVLLTLRFLMDCNDAKPAVNKDNLIKSNRLASPWKEYPNYLVLFGFIALFILIFYPILPINSALKSFFGDYTSIILRILIITLLLFGSFYTRKVIEWVIKALAICAVLFINPISAEWLYYLMFFVMFYILNNNNSGKIYARNVANIVLSLFVMTLMLYTHRSLYIIHNSFTLYSIIDLFVIAGVLMPFMIYNAGKKRSGELHNVE